MIETLSLRINHISLYACSSSRTPVHDSIFTRARMLVQQQTSKQHKLFATLLERISVNKIPGFPLVRDLQPPKILESPSNQMMVSVDMESVSLYDPINATSQQLARVGIKCIQAYKQLARRVSSGSEEQVYSHLSMTVNNIFTNQVGDLVIVDFPIDSRGENRSGISRIKEILYYYVSMSELHRNKKQSGEVQLADMIRDESVVTMDMLRMRLQYFLMGYYKGNQKQNQQFDGMLQPSLNLQNNYNIQGSFSKTASASREPTTIRSYLKENQPMPSLDMSNLPLRLLDHPKSDFSRQPIYEEKPKKSRSSSSKNQSILQGFIRRTSKHTEGRMIRQSSNPSIPNLLERQREWRQQQKNLFLQPKLRKKSNNKFNLKMLTSASMSEYRVIPQVSTRKMQQKPQGRASNRIANMPNIWNNHIVSQVENNRRQLTQQHDVSYRSFQKSHQKLPRRILKLSDGYLSNRVNTELCTDISAARRKVKQSGLYTVQQSVYDEQHMALDTKRAEELEHRLSQDQNEVQKLDLEGMVQRDKVDPILTTERPEPKQLGEIEVDNQIDLSDIIIICSPKNSQHAPPAKQESFAKSDKETATTQSNTFKENVEKQVLERYNVIGMVVGEGTKIFSRYGLAYKVPLYLMYKKFVHLRLSLLDGMQQGLLHVRESLQLEYELETKELVKSSKTLLANVRASCASHPLMIKSADIFKLSSFDKQYYSALLVSTEELYNKLKHEIMQLKRTQDMPFLCKYLYSILLCFQEERKEQAGSDNLFESKFEGNMPGSLLKQIEDYLNVGERQFGKLKKHLLFGSKTGQS